ncbi:hypothetical protein Mal35_33580 [Gimesia maris]|nr:hypothetical protein Mal35_33580 [Gimesia maris]
MVCYSSVPVKPRYNRSNSIHGLVWIEWEDISDEWELLEESEDFEPQVVVPGQTDRVFSGSIPKSLEVYWYREFGNDID